MSEAKFSKGPWHIKWPVPSELMGRRLFTAENGAIMGNDKYYPWTPINTYDWFLIASAPDMYAEIEHEIECLYQSLHDLDDGSLKYAATLKKIDRKTKLLAKARGE